jgi:hypothetical protein
MSATFYLRLFILTIAHLVFDGVNGFKYIATCFSSRVTLLERKEMRRSMFHKNLVNEGGKWFELNSHIVDDH